MALFLSLLGGLVAAATILGGVYALCLWRFRRSPYNRLSESVPGSTEKLVTSTEVSIYESREEGGLRNNEDNEQSRIDAAEGKGKAAVDEADQLQVASGGRAAKNIESTSGESAESSEVGDQESKPLLAGSGPKEAAKYGIASEVNAAQIRTLPTHSNIPVPTKEKHHTPSGSACDTLPVSETEIKQEVKFLEISTVSEDAITTQQLPAETIKQQKPKETLSDEPKQDESEITEKQKLEPLIDLTGGDGAADTLPLLAQTSEVEAADKHWPTDRSSGIAVESEKPTPSSVKTSTPVITTTEKAASKESIADKLNALFQPKLQKETEDLNEHTQTFPPMTRSPLPHVAPKPAPRKSQPNASDLSPRPASSASPGGAPPVAAKPVGQARKQAFSPSAVPVLPMAFGKGGFVLRRKADSTGEEGKTGARLPMGSAMFNGGFGARPRSEGGVEEPTSFDQVGERGEERKEREREREREIQREYRVFRWQL